jgi:hypothetical protein
MRGEELKQLKPLDDQNAMYMLTVRSPMLLINVQYINTVYNNEIGIREKMLSSVYIKQTFSSSTVHNTPVI